MNLLVAVPCLGVHVNVCPGTHEGTVRRLLDSGVCVSDGQGSGRQYSIWEDGGCSSMRDGVERIISHHQPSEACPSNSRRRGVVRRGSGTICSARFLLAHASHFAACAYVGESFKDPARHYANNVIGALHLLDAARSAGNVPIVFSSTCAVYGEPASVPITEEAALAPVNPYGRTKLAVEHALADYKAAYGLRSVRLRRRP